MSEPHRSKQYLCSVAVSLGGFLVGSILGWPSAAEKCLIKDYNLSLENDIKWVKNSLLFAALIGAIVMVLVVDVLGSKLTRKIAVITGTIGWILIATTKNKSKLCLANGLLGYGMSIIIIHSPIYISEIADKSIRGRLCLVFSVLIFFGIFIVHSLGKLQNIYSISIPYLIISWMYFWIMLHIIESPILMIRKRRLEKSQMALQKLRGEGYDIATEFGELREYSATPLLFRWEKRMILISFVVIMLYLICQGSGIFIIIFNLSQLLGANTNANDHMIVLSFVQVLFCTLSAVLVDKFNRRAIWIVSLVIMAIGQFIAAIHIDSKSESFSIGLPLALYAAGFSIGAGPLTFLMSGELLPYKIKTTITCVSIICSFALGTLLFNSFPSISQSNKVHNLFYGFSACCIIGIFFVIIFVPETKGKSLRDIQNEMKEE